MTQHDAALFCSDTNTEPVCLHRGTAAIGPLIAALKNGTSVTYNGKEVAYEVMMSLLCCSPLHTLTLFVLCCRSDPSRSARPLTRGRSSSLSSARQRSSWRRSAAISSCAGSRRSSLSDGSRAEEQMFKCVLWSHLDAKQGVRKTPLCWWST